MTVKNVYITNLSKVTPAVKLTMGSNILYASPEPYWVLTDLLKQGRANMSCKASLYSFSAIRLELYVPL